MAPMPDPSPRGGSTRVLVVGQGYVGLPLAMRAVEVGHDVVGFDTDEHRIKQLNAAESYVDDVSRRSPRGGAGVRPVPGRVPRLDAAPALTSP